MRCGTFRHVGLRYGTLRYGTVRYVTRSVAVRYVTLRCSTLRHGTVRRGVVYLAIGVAGLSGRETVLVAIRIFDHSRMAWCAENHRGGKNYHS